ncbi:MAG: hypothetical protein IE926_08750 [Micrococcales bacterium]|nr:hypothetical protein [Micrococcales bacterium]
MTLRIASVPTDHVYVRHLSDPDGRGATVRLPDPRPDRVVTGAPWWPPRVLDPAWVTAHADEFDLVHVHFGYDAESPADLAAWTETLRRLGKPLRPWPSDGIMPIFRDFRDIVVSILRISQQTIAD